MELSSLGIAKTKEMQFKRKGITTVEELARFIPRKYNNYSVITGIIPDAECVSTLAVVKNVKLYDTGMPVVMAFCIDKYTEEKINVVWFHQKYIYKKISQLIGQTVMIGGKFIYNNEYDNYSVNNPDVFSLCIDENQKLHPVYSKITGMSDEYLQTNIQKALQQDYVLTETLPFEYSKKYDYLSTKEMLMHIHNPQNPEMLEKAKRRMIFDDLVYFSLRLQYAARKNSKGSQYGVKTLEITNRIKKSLPFSLTEDQNSAVVDMITKMKDGRRIQALVQGDVGTGKTIVAFLMMLVAVDSGYQSVMMAPTQVLAKQHYEAFAELIKDENIKVAYLDSNSYTKKERREILKQIASGEIQVVIGTHSVISKDVEFKDLALTVTDEEHKFGVMQREALTKKAERGVHTISMSATPIPRSLAQVLYGDTIDLYTIKTMPNGRKPIKTAINNSYKGTMRFVEMQLKEGRQAYVVCPLIEKNEELENVKSVNEIFNLYNEYFKSKGFSVAVLTGKNTVEETNQIISDFKNNKTQILIATTVIEVGVNVPNASTIVIHNAERFGLSALHQLRGRVGRGKYQSYCVLFSDDKDNDRLNVMVDQTDGFIIAEEDLRLRGTGDFIGTKQSGDDKFISLMLACPEIYEQAKKVASELLDTRESCVLLSSVINAEETNNMQ